MIRKAKLQKFQNSTLSYVGMKGRYERLFTQYGSNGSQADIDHETDK